MNTLAPSLLCTAFVFLAVELALSEMAKQHERWRFSAPTRYVIGVAAVMVLSLPGCLAYGWLQPWLVVLAHFAAAGAVVCLWWRFSDKQPVETWPGMGPERISNRAIALIENQQALASVTRDLLIEALVRLDDAQLYQEMLRWLDAKDSSSLSIKALRRVMAEKMGAEND